MNIFFFIWITTVSGIPTMNTHLRYPDFYTCNQVVMSFEREYYLDRMPHRRAKSGESYHMECLTNQEVIGRLEGTSKDAF